MNSCLYECAIMHARLAPRPHRFVYRLFYFALDLDELPTLHRALPLFSIDRRNLYAFHDRDHLPLPPATPGATDLKARVVAYLGREGIDLTGGRVVLVTLPRIAGYLFNPVSFYFCYDRHGTPVASVAEVTNTFREVKLYLLGPAQRSTTADGAATFHLRIPKHFYVSPFSDVDVAFDFTLRPPGDQLRVQIDDFTNGARTLTSTVTGERRPLTAARLAWYSLKYPLLTLRIITLIHWHAFRLWLKRVPWFPKAARAGDQRDLLRPHSSLQPTPP